MGGPDWHFDGDIPPLQEFLAGDTPAATGRDGARSELATGRVRRMGEPDWHFDGGCYSE